MEQLIVISLGQDDRLARLLGPTMPRARIISVPCLDHLGSLTDETDVRVLVDPRSVRSCCLKKIQALGRPRAPSVAGGTSVRSGLPRMTCRQAWRRRSELLNPATCGETAGLFIALARVHDKERCTVQEAATTLCMTPRHLHRLVTRATGCSPASILSLARAVSIARSLSHPNLKLVDIARLHRFPDQSTMNRLFNRFVDMSPGAYRSSIHGLIHDHDVRKRQQIRPKAPMDLSHHST